jgi:uncharacterized SAM-binding protein YcdF (DUF218 family)
MKKRNLKLIIKYGTIGLIIFLAGFLWFAYSATQVVIESPDKISKKDAIVVFTGGKRRILSGLKMFVENRADKIFISGAASEIKIDDVIMLVSDPKDRLYLELNRSRMHMGYEADNTLENAIETAKWIKEEEVKSLIFITSFYHMKRAILSLQYFIDDNVKIVKYPIYTDKESPVKWYNNSRVSGLYFDEYVKYLAVNLWLFFGFENSKISSNGGSEK